MPKANEVKNTKVTAEADPKSAETQAAPEVKADAAEEKAEVTEVKADTAEKKAKAASASKPGRKSATKKAAAKKAEKTENVFIQWADQEIELSAIVDKVKTATKSLRAVHEINIYVKPEENRAYYVAKKTKGEEVGSVEI